MKNKEYENISSQNIIRDAKSGRYLFKYVSPDAIQHVLKLNKVSIRFSYTMFYNDPYELFLQLAEDGDIKYNARALFYYIYETLPQFPVTCFSRDPSSIVMWSHYANDHKGICIGFNEKKLTNQFSAAFIGNVQYINDPMSIKDGVMDYLSYSGKKTNTKRIIAKALTLAYFSKRKDWQYEKERRIVIQPNEATKIDEKYFTLEIDANTIDYIIFGQETAKEDIIKTRDWAYDNNIKMIFMRNSKYFIEPFYVAQESIFQWDNLKDEFITKEICRICGEPNPNIQDSICPRCQITPEIENYVIMQNQYFTLINLGLEKPTIWFEGIDLVGNDLNHLE